MQSIIRVALFALLVVVAMAKPHTRPTTGRWDAHERGKYSDAFTRDHLLPLAAAAYSDDPQACVGRNYANATVSLHIKSRCLATDRVEHCSGFTAVSHTERAIIIAFRGTENFIQLMVEVEHVVLRPKKPSPIGGHVAAYFHDVFTHLWERGIGADVRALVAAYPEYEIWIVGHSLGGAVASIAGATILEELKVDNERIKIVTYGQPRTGDWQYAFAHQLKLPRTYRVTHSHDLVSHLPPRGFEGYYHHGNEIWYPKNMAATDKFVVCKLGESDKCSDRGINVNLDDHAHYFVRWVSRWGIAGCAATA